MWSIPPDARLREYPAKYATFLVEMIPSFREISRGDVPKAQSFKT